MYKAIFIDIDDTILDYIPCCREAFEAALPEHPEHFQLFFDISGRLFSEAKHGLHTIAVHNRNGICYLYNYTMKGRAGSVMDTSLFEETFRGGYITGYKLN